MPIGKALTPGGGTAEHRTPIDLFKHLQRKYQLNYDAFASHENALLPVYSALQGTFVRPEGFAEAWRVNELTGLEYPWEGARVWMNPPYGRGILAACMKKAAEERSNAELIVALIPVATGTAWWQKFVAPYADVYYVPGRVKFLDAEGKHQGSAGFDSCVAVYRRLGWV